MQFRIPHLFLWLGYSALAFGCLLGWYQLREMNIESLRLRDRFANPKHENRVLFEDESFDVTWKELVNRDEAWAKSITVRSGRRFTLRVLVGEQYFDFESAVITDHETLTMYVSVFDFMPSACKVCIGLNLEWRILLALSLRRLPLAV